MTLHQAPLLTSVCVISHGRLFVTPWTIAHQALLSMEFSRHEYLSGLPFPPPEDLPNPGTLPRILNPGFEPGSPALQPDSLPTELGKKPLKEIVT